MAGRNSKENIYSHVNVYLLFGLFFIASFYIYLHCVVAIVLTGFVLERLFHLPKLLGKTRIYFRVSARMLKFEVDRFLKKEEN